MTIVAKGNVRKAYIEVSETSASIARIVFYLDETGWIELTGIVSGGDGEFKLPAPIGCQCTVTEIRERQWNNANYEVDFASSYTTDGIFWAMEYREVDGI